MSNTVLELDLFDYILYCSLFLFKFYFNFLYLELYE